MKFSDRVLLLHALQPDQNDSIADTLSLGGYIQRRLFIRRE